MTPVYNHDHMYSGPKPHTGHQKGQLRFQDCALGDGGKQMSSSETRGWGSQWRRRYNHKLICLRPKPRTGHQKIHIRFQECAWRDLDNQISGSETGGLAHSICSKKYVAPSYTKKTRSKETKVGKVAMPDLFLFVRLLMCERLRGIHTAGYIMSSTIVQILPLGPFSTLFRNLYGYTCSL